MNRTESLERELTAWFGETAAPRVPDYTDDIVRLTGGLGQRPRWTFPERWFPMSAVTLARRSVRPVAWRTIGLLAVLALLIAAMFAAYIGSHPKVPPPFGFAANGFVALGVNGPSGDAGDVVAIDPATGETITIVGGPNDDAYPTYSHDGTRIVFDRKVTGGEVMLAINADGSGAPIQLTKPDRAGVYGLVWSPDDKQIAYINPKLVVAAADGSGAKTFDLDVDAYYPIWRPGRSSDIAFNGASDADSSKNGYYIVRSDGSNLRPIVGLDGRLVDGGPIQFTPDGGSIVATQPPVDGVQKVRVHVLAVGDDGRVTRDQAIGPDVLSATSGYPLSPDGTRVVAAVPVTAAGDAWRIGIISLDESAQVVLTGPVFTGSGFGLAWSPDGTTIGVNDSTMHKIWLLDPAGGDHRLASWIDPSGEAPMWQRLAP
jgi:WD40 repeat protein